MRSGGSRALDKRGSVLAAAVRHAGAKTLFYMDTGVPPRPERFVTS